MILERNNMSANSDSLNLHRAADGMPKDNSSSHLSLYYLSGYELDHAPAPCFVFAYGAVFGLAMVSNFPLVDPTFLLQAVYLSAC